MKNSTEKLQAKKSIEDQKKEDKFLFQFVSAEDGRRSEPFQGSWEAVTEILNHRKENEKPGNEDYILLVAVLDGKDTRIPPTPLITVKTFLEFESNQNKVAQNV